MKKIFVLAVACLIYISCHAQTSGKTLFAEFIVEGVPSIDAYRAIDLEMRAIPNVQLSRMDIPTKRYYVVFTSDGSWDEQWFTEKFLELGGYTIHCFMLGNPEIDEFTPITWETCEELNH